MEIERLKNLLPQGVELSLSGLVEETDFNDLESIIKDYLDNYQGDPGMQSYQSYNVIQTFSRYFLMFVSNKILLIRKEKL